MTSLVSFIHRIKQAIEFADDFHRQTKSKALKRYSDRLKWCLMDLQTSFQDQEIRDALRNEISSDSFAADAIAEKVKLLNPNQREVVEMIVDAYISGEEINFGESEK